MNKYHQHEHCIYIPLWILNINYAFNGEYHGTLHYGQKYICLLHTIGFSRQKKRNLLNTRVLQFIRLLFNHIPHTPQHPNQNHSLCIFFQLLRPPFPKAGFVFCVLKQLAHFAGEKDYHYRRYIEQNKRRQMGVGDRNYNKPSAAC